MAIASIALIAGAVARDARQVPVAVHRVKAITHTPCGHCGKLATAWNAERAPAAGKIPHPFDV